MSSEDRELLKEVAVGGEGLGAGPRAGELVQVHVTGCAFSCCGRGWSRRDGYEQTYTGYVDNLTDATFMLYSVGIGTMSYVIAARFDELVEVDPALSG